MLNVKIEHFRNLVTLAGADGKIEAVELEALKKIANEQGIADDRLEFMLKKSAEYAFIIPQNQVERHKQMKDMIELAIIDGDFHKAEHDLIIKVGRKLKYSEVQVKELIEAIVKDRKTSA